MTEKNHKWMWIVLILIVILVMGIRYKPIGYKLQHEYPVYVGSADANSRVGEAEYFAQSGQSFYIDPWYDDQNRENIVAPEPPLAGTLAAMLTSVSGVGAYDTLLFVQVMTSIGVALCFFIIFWKLFDNAYLGLITAAIISYPVEAFYNYHYQLGLFPHFSQLALLTLTLLFTVMFYEKKNIESIYGIAITWVCAFYYHATIPIVMSLFIGIVMLYMLIKKEIKFKPIIILGACVIICILPFVPIFISNWFLGEHNKVTDLFEPGLLLSNRDAGNTIQITNFVNIWYYLFLIAGIVSCYFVLKDKKYKLVGWFFLFFFAVMMITPYLGLYHNQLYDKPKHIFFEFAYPIIAIGIYVALLFAKDLLKMEKSRLMMLALILLIVFQIFTFTKIPSAAGSLLTKNTYDGYTWAKDNIPEKKSMLCFGCIQFEGVYTHHPTSLPAYEVDNSVVPQLLDLAQNNDTQGIIKTGMMGHPDKRVYFDGLSVKQYGPRPEQNQSVCNFDYFIFKGLGDLTPYISQISQKMVSKGGKIIYSNNEMIILQNNNVGGECI